MLNELQVKKILVVEDNEVNQKVMQRLITIFGHNHLVVGDGLKAIQAVEDYKPDLIFMDVQLVEISGVDLARQIKENPETSHIPVVMVTAFASAEDREKIIKDSRCDAYLSKPFMPQDLSAITERFFPVKKTEWRK